MREAVIYYSSQFEKQMLEQGNEITLNVDDQIVKNIDDLEGGSVEWQSELPRYKNTLGIILNLFQNDADMLEKLKSDSDSTLEDIGVELDGNLNNSVIFKDCARLLTADLLTFSLAS